MIRKLGIDELIASKPSPQRDLVIAMIAERLSLSQLQAGSHPTSARHHLGRGAGGRLRYRGSPLRGHGLALEAAGSDRTRLAQRHLGEGAPVLYDVTSSYTYYARLLIARGDYDRYRRLCKRLIDAFEQQVNPQMAFCAAQTIGLAPGPPIQARKVISLVDRAIPLERRHAEIDFALALVYLRVEEFDRAAILLHKFTDREPDRAWRSWPVLAIIDRRLGRMEELKSRSGQSSGVARST